MAQEKKDRNKKILRIALWSVAAGLFLVSLGLLLLNYQTLENTVAVSEKNSDDQGKISRYYVKEYTVAKAALDETTKALETAKAEVKSIQQTNDELRANIAVLERFKSAAMEKEKGLEDMILAFKKKNQELDSELQGVRKELANFQPEIKDLDEGRGKIEHMKKQIHLVKKNMGAIRHQAYEMQKAAEKEQNRLEALYGNGGYLVKDGQDKSVLKFDQKSIDIKVRILNK